MNAIGTVNGLVIDCADPIALARFWSAMFATDVDSIEDEDEAPRYVDLRPREGVPVLRFQRVPEPKEVKNRLHLDVEVASLDDATAQVESLGARALTERGTEYGWHFRVMADPEANEFCLIEEAAAHDSDSAPDSDSVVRS